MHLTRMHCALPRKNHHNYPQGSKKQKENKASFKKVFSHSQLALFPRVKRIYVLFALHNKLETTDRKIIIGIQNQMLAILGRW